MQALINIETGRVLQIVADTEVFPVHPLLEWMACGAGVTTAHIWSGGEYNLLVPPTAADQVEAIRAEAERRIDLGMLVDGVTFRCDTQSIARLSGLLTWARNLEADQQPVAITFNTQAGVTVTITTAAEAQALFDAASAHVAAMLAKSSDLQAAPPADPTDNQHWV